MAEFGSTGGPVEGAGHHEEPQPHESRERLRARADELAEDVRRVGRSAKGLAQDALEEAVHAGEDARDRGVERARELEDSVVEYVRAKPIQSLLIAAATGFVLSSVLRR